MSPERWRRIGELFDTAVAVSPPERAEWLRRACDGDDDLHTEVANLLAEDARAEQGAFLSQSHESLDRLEQTPDWPSYDGRALTDRIGERERHEIAPQVESEGFLPKAAIAAGGGDWLADETRAVVRTRLRELTVIYALIFGMFLILRPFLLGLPGASIATPFWGAIALLGSFTFSFRAVTLYRWPGSESWSW